MSMTLGVFVAVVAVFTVASMVAGIVASTGRGGSSGSSQVSPVGATGTATGDPTSVLDLAAAPVPPVASARPGGTLTPGGPTPPIGDAAQVAHDFVIAFFRTAPGQQQWWAGLTRFLTPQAAQAYQATDSANVLVTSITGPARALPQQVENAVSVQVPTKVGVYVVNLTRAEPAQRWLVERLVLPPKAPPATKKPVVTKKPSPRRPSPRRPSPTTKTGRR
jgi:hypothetical protein